MYKEYKVNRDTLH